MPWRERDVGERLQPVADRRGLLEGEVLARRLHLRLELGLDGAAAAGQERPGLLDQRGIVLGPDPADAGCRAALDLILQAGPGAVLEDAVGARADREGAQQRAERLVDRARRGERAEIVAVLALGAAMPADPRERLLLRGLADIDVGERLVVAQDDVERRPVPLDHVAFEQQRLDVARRGDHLERPGERHHALQAGAQRGGLGIGRDPLAQRLGLADVEHLALGIEHAVDAGRIRQARRLLLQERCAGQLGARGPSTARRLRPARALCGIAGVAAGGSRGSPARLLELMTLRLTWRPVAGASMTAGRGVRLPRRRRACGAAPAIGGQRHLGVRAGPSPTPRWGPARARTCSSTNTCA